MTRIDNHSCERCGSHNTQPVPLAYSQTVRVGYSGRETVSRYGQDLAPPERKDDLFLPSIVACTVTAAVVFTGPAVCGMLGFTCFSDTAIFDLKRIAIGIPLGWAVGLALAIPAIKFNSWKLPALLARWEAEVVCKRCGHRWRRSVSSRNNDEGAIVE